MFPQVLVGLIKLSLRGHGQGELAQVLIGRVGGSLCCAEEDKGVPAANSHVVILPTIPRTRGTSQFHAENAAIKPECSFHVVGVHGDMIEYGSPRACVKSIDGPCGGLVVVPAKAGAQTSSPV